MQRIAPVAVALVLGCGGAVTSPPDSTGDSATTTTSSSGSGAGGAGAGVGGSGSGVGGSSFTVPPGQTYADVSCKDGEMLLFVELWPSAAADCNPKPDVDPGGVLVLGVSGWDGAPGTFVVGADTAHGTAQAGTGFEEATGTITIEPFATTPRVISWDLSAGAGTTDLGLCGHFEKFPCAPAP